MVEEMNTFLIEMDRLHGIETPIYIYTKEMNKKGNKIRCKRKEDNVHKRLEIN